MLGKMVKKWDRVKFYSSYSYYWTENFISYANETFYFSILEF